jgi:transcriptional regulator with XRE-family HTH domain
MKPLPSTYGALARWYPRLTDRARALGISRQTLTAWERDRDAVRMRPRTAARIDLVASVTADVEDLVGDPAGAGVWMRAPQPLAGGRTPAQLVVERRLAEVRNLMFPSVPDSPARRVTVRVADTHFGFGVVPRERPRSRGEALVLERIGEDPRMIGPVAD